MARSLFIMIVLGAIFSCKSNRVSKLQYYPIKFFIEKELASMDSTSMPIKCYRFNGIGSDSSIINTTEFRGIVNELLLNILSASDALDSYEETTINDLNLDFITLSYTAPKKIITKIDLHIDPKSEKVKSLYAEKTDLINDTIITRKILLTSGSQLLVNTMININNNIEKRTERYNWSLNHIK